MTYDNANLRRLQENARRVSQPQRVSLLDMFNPGFMARNTQYPTFEALLAASGHSEDTVEDFKALFSSDEWNRHIVKSTRFASWNEMELAAGAERLKGTLLDGLK